MIKRLQISETFILLWKCIKTKNSARPWKTIVKNITPDPPVILILRLVKSELECENNLKPRFICVKMQEQVISLGFF